MDDHLWALNKAYLVTLVAISLLIVSLGIGDVWNPHIYLGGLVNVLGTNAL
jgi:hypothetical protein